MPPMRLREGLAFPRDVPSANGRHITFSAMTRVLFSDVVGSSSFTVMDTDYDNYAMVCTCQVKQLKTYEGKNPI